MGGHVIVLVGNKADLESSRQVPRETAQNLADELNIKYESRDKARPVLHPNCTLISSEYKMRSHFEPPPTHSAQSTHPMKKKNLQPIIPPNEQPQNP